MNPKKSAAQMPAAKRIQWQIPDDKFADFEAALNKYHFWNNAQFVSAAVDALIRAYKSGDELPRDLKFQPISNNK